MNVIDGAFPSEEEKNTLYIHAIDADGCFFAGHENLKNHIKTTKSGITKTNTKLMCGSARQDIFTDYSNASSRGTPSIFKALFVFSEELACDLDRFLLADLYNNKDDGYNFDLGLEQLDDEGKYHKAIADQHHYDQWCFDDSKFTLLYAQLHHVAKKYPNDDIVFNFYDDRESILKGLRMVFINYPHLMPKNVTLKLHKYAGKQVELLTVKSGTGEVDLNYRSTVVFFEKMDRVLTKKRLQNHNMLAAFLSEEEFNIKFKIFCNLQRLKVRSSIQDEKAFMTLVKSISLLFKEYSDVEINLIKKIRLNELNGIKSGYEKKMLMEVSQAYKETNTMLAELGNSDATIDTKISAIHQHKNFALTLNSHFNLKHTLLLVSAVAIGFAIGAYAGFCISLLTGPAAPIVAAPLALSLGLAAAFFTINKFSKFFPTVDQDVLLSVTNQTRFFKPNNSDNINHKRAGIIPVFKK